MAVYLQEESIVTAAMEAEAAAARAAAAAAAQPPTSASRNSRQRAGSHASLFDSVYDAFDTEFGQMSLEDERMRPSRPASWTFQAPGKRNAGSSSVPSTPAGADAAAAIEQRLEQQRAAVNSAWGSPEGGQQQQDGDQPEQEEKETLHRLCPTYASDINSPLRHVRTRIYFTSESHIHSLINVLRYCHLPYPHASGSGSTSMSPAPSGLAGVISQQSSVSVRQGAAAAVTAVTATTGSAASVAAATPNGVAAAAAAAAGPEGSVMAAAFISGRRSRETAAPAAAGSESSSSSVFASAAGAAVATAAAGADASMAAAASASTPQSLVNPEGQALLEETDEFDYLTHIVFRMYENKQVRGVGSACQASSTSEVPQPVGEALLHIHCNS